MLEVLKVYYHSIRGTLYQYTEAETAPEKVLPEIKKQNREHNIQSTLGLSKHQIELYTTFVLAARYRSSFSAHGLSRILRDPYYEELERQNVPIIANLLRQVREIGELFDTRTANWTQKAQEQAAKYVNAAKTVARAMYLNQHQPTNEEGKTRLLDSGEYAVFENQFMRSIGTPASIRNAANLVTAYFNEQRNNGQQKDKDATQKFLENMKIRDRRS